MKRTFAAVALLAALSACSSNPTPVAPSTPPVAPTSAAGSAPAVANPCDPAKDMGCGTPDVECATNRLGKQFVADGVVYTCGGEKPYHWRRG